MRTNIRRIILLILVITSLIIPVMSTLAADFTYSNFLRNDSIQTVPEQNYVGFLGSEARTNMSDIHQRIWYNAYGNFAKGSYTESANDFSSVSAGLLAG
ncbi:MAG: hypothetical protein ACRC2T_00320, partial [Thermoguttaceae bacterium]